MEKKKKLFEIKNSVFVEYVCAKRKYYQNKVVF